MYQKLECQDKFVKTPRKEPDLLVSHPSFHRCLNSALNATTAPDGQDDTTKMERVVTFVNYYKNAGLQLTQGNIRGMIHVLQGAGDPRATEWFRHHRHLYSCNLADIVNTKTIFINFQLTGYAHFFMDALNFFGENSRLKLSSVVW